MCLFICAFVRACPLEFSQSVCDDRSVVMKNFQFPHFILGPSGCIVCVVDPVAAAENVMDRTVLLLMVKLTTSVKKGE